MPLARNWESSNLLHMTKTTLCALLVARALAEEAVACAGSTAAVAVRRSLERVSVVSTGPKSSPRSIPPVRSYLFGPTMRETPALIPGIDAGYRHLGFSTRPFPRSTEGRKVSFI
jgi:hypothetical protein